MRAIVSSVLVATVLTACGVKPPAVEHAAPEGSVSLLEVVKQIRLERPGAQFGRALRITVAPNGDIYVLDPDHNRILRYNPDGTIQRSAGGFGSGPLQFDVPIDFDTDGLAIWILDRQNRRLVRLDLMLNFIEEISLQPDSDGLSAPIWYDALACTANGDIVLLDKSEPKAVRLSPTGDLLASYGGFGMGDGRLDHPVDLAVSHTGDLYVADGKRLLQYDRAGNFRRAYGFQEPLVDVAANGEAVWAIVGDGRLYHVSNRQTHADIVDPASGSPAPIAIATGRDGDPVILDRELIIWLFAPLAP